MDHGHRVQHPVELLVERAAVMAALALLVKL